MRMDLPLVLHAALGPTFVVLSGKMRIHDPVRGGFQNAHGTGNRLSRAFNDFPAATTRAPGVVDEIARRGGLRGRGFGEQEP
jgi:hypothetical protein